MVTDFFIKIEGVDGEAKEQNHQKWIEVVSFNHGAVQNIALGRAAEVSGRGQFTPFIFSHLLDKATPKLLKYCMTGQKINKVVFQACRAIGGAQVPVYEVTLENAKISRIDVDTVVEETSTVTETASQASTFQAKAYQVLEKVEMVAAKMTWKVTPIKTDNTKDGAVEASFDQMINA